MAGYIYREECLKTKELALEDCKKELIEITNTILDTVLPLEEKKVNRLKEILTEIEMQKIDELFFSKMFESVKERIQSREDCTQAEKDRMIASAEKFHKNTIESRRKLRESERIDTNASVHPDNDIEGLFE